MGEGSKGGGAYLLFLPYIIQGQGAKDGFNFNLKPAGKWEALCLCQLSPTSSALFLFFFASPFGTGSDLAQVGFQLLCFQKRPQIPNSASVSQMLGDRPVPSHPVSAVLWTEPGASHVPDQHSTR